MAKKKMTIAYLTQEFDVNLDNTVREEFQSVYKEQIKVVRWSLAYQAWSSRGRRGPSNCPLAFAT